MGKLQPCFLPTRLCAEMDAAADDGWSPGTFRWPPRMSLPTLPPGRPSAASVSDKGWGPYLRQRGGEDMVASARSNAIMLDALSFPLSLAWLLQQESLVRCEGSGALHVVVLGATSKAEVRVLQESDYWGELTQLQQVQLHFVGPEVSSSKGRAEFTPSSRLVPNNSSSAGRTCCRRTHCASSSTVALATLSLLAAMSFCGAGCRTCCF
ncbi:unnamed protein product [Effrenium voratum]|nr:unnamed protein product [Effrenium voratum]